ncbi:hypothetical protein BgiBS90_014171 [Biomphalaria glabrata]|nr:hypothetical protein BgiBS90_014171 [Biomphalaria glabrata]
MASNTRSKTDSDRKLRIQELTETAALLELEGPSRSDYIRQKLEEWEKLVREKEVEREKREFELAMEKEKHEHELAKEKEKLQLEHEKLKNEQELARDREKYEHELAMERERQATERAKIAQENETARTVADSQPASPASSQGVRRRWCGQQSWPPHINMIPAWNHKGGSRHRFPPSPSYCNSTPSPLTASGRTHRYPNKPDLNHRSRYSPPKHNSPRWNRN